MKKFELISKDGCHKCSDLKAWFKKNSIEFIEESLEDQEVVTKLLNDPKFAEVFCDKEGCIAYTPIIHVEETGDYIHEELFGLDGLQENYVKNLLDI